MKRSIQETFTKQEFAAAVAIHAMVRRTKKAFHQIDPDDQNKYLRIARYVLRRVAKVER